MMLHPRLNNDGGLFFFCLLFSYAMTTKSCLDCGSCVCGGCSFSFCFSNSSGFFFSFSNSSGFSNSFGFSSSFGCVGCFSACCCCGGSFFFFSFSACGGCGGSFSFFGGGSFSFGTLSFGMIFFCLFSCGCGGYSGSTTSSNCLNSGCSSRSYCFGFSACGGGSFS